jgi:hypothetical protein
VTTAINWTPETVARARQRLKDWADDVERLSIIADAFAEVAEEHEDQRRSILYWAAHLRHRMAADGIGEVGE